MVDFLGARFYCLCALAHSNRCIRDKMVQFSSMMVTYTVSVPQKTSLISQFIHTTTTTTTTTFGFCAPDLVMSYSRQHL